MKLPRAILFDNDGVLVASEPLHQEAWSHVLRRLGLPYLEEDFAHLVGMTAPETLARLLDRYRPGWKREEYDLDACALEKNGYYLESVPTALRAYPGVPEGLQWLKTKQVRTAVVSNAKRRELEAAMTTTGIGEWLEVKLSRDDVPRPKPDPLPYLTAAALLGFAPAECFAVEDSPTGLEASLMAKVPSIGIASHYSVESLSQPIPNRPDLKPIRVFPSMKAFFEWLQQLD